MSRFISSLRNLSQPVNRLPPEILSRVARYVLPWYARDASAMFRLTRVCRYWRESIVSTPENWTLISSSFGNVAALSLERAKAAPLEIWLSMDSMKKFLRLPDIIIPHFQKAITLVVDSISTSREFTTMFPKFPQSAPNLRSLTLELKGPHDWDLSIDPFESFTHTLTYLKLVKIPLYPSFLRLRTLTRLTLTDRQFNLHLDTLLDFLEENDSLESAELEIKFVGPSLRNSRRRAVVGNRLLYLSIYFWDVMDVRALLANIPLLRGAHLDISSGRDTLNDIFSGIPITHFLNLQSPIFMDYVSYMGKVRLHGPNGIFSFRRTLAPKELLTDFLEFPLIPLTNVRELHITTREPVLFPLSCFPALETLAIHCQIEIDVSDVLSALLSNPSSSPSLKTLALLHCDFTDDFMEKLTRFASSRRNASTSAWLHRVLAVSWEGHFPSVDLVNRLKDYVAIVDFRMGCELPTDLT